MLRLLGFSASNYYNVAKLALLEKGLSFEEVLQYTGVGPKYRPEYLDASPLGKVPCLQTDDGYLTESRCIVDYLELAHPQPPLFPADPFQHAKVLELTQIIDLYLEWPARRLLPFMFGKKPVPERVADEALEAVGKGLRAVQQLASFDGYLLGDRFSAADIAGVIHFPTVRRVLKQSLQRDPIGEVPGLMAYVKRMEQRPTVQRVRADQAESYPKFMQHLHDMFGIDPS